jgi:tRNA pseudouridine55 synthase
MKQKPVPAAMQPFLDGKVLLIDKPLHWTSFDVVKKIRTLTKVSKVGHAGTLDPLATGLLIICTGKYTKEINDYMGMEKEYIGTFTLGATTATYDMESAPENLKSFDTVTEEQIYGATKQFTGAILQMPPIYSALKIEGKPAYRLARKGKEVVLEPRPVIITTFEIIKVVLPQVHFRVVCSTGTYIRSLATDFGKTVGTGAYLSSLRRTRIGGFLVEGAKGMKEIEDEVRGLYKTGNNSTLPENHQSNS